MELYLYKNISEKNCIGKVLDMEKILEGNLRESSSVINPVINIQAVGSAITRVFNYAYIPDFNRYYFITGIRNISRNIWEISLSVDVLESFKDSIKSNYAILSDTEITGKDNYIAGEQWRANVKNSTAIMRFSNGLSSSGTYILITAGG